MLMLLPLTLRPREARLHQPPRRKIQRPLQPPPAKQSRKLNSRLKKKSSRRKERRRKLKRLNYRESAP